jgi:Tetracyclin repressor-like, C-terminal domain
VDNVINPIRGLIRTILERGIERGELRSDLELEPLVDLLHALPIYKILTSRGDPASIAKFPNAYMPLLLPGIRGADV